MNAVEYISLNVDARKILEYYNFRNIDETDDSIRSCCEVHKGNNPTAFVWNKTNNLWYCYTGNCGGGDIFTLIEKMDGVKFTEAVSIAAKILGISIDGMEIKQQSNIIKRNTLKWLEFMKKKSVSLSDEPYELPTTRYFDSHNSFNRFNRETLEFYNAKFCKIYPLENSLLYNKLVIPIVFKDICRGVALRDTTGKYHPKWMYQPKSLLIGNLLYNYDLALNVIKYTKTNEIILVEGIFDVWAYHNIGIDNVVAILGSSLKNEQGKILLKNGFDIVTSFDNDEAGNKCTNAVTKYFKYKSGLRTIYLPKGYDPGDCNKEELMECYLNRK